MTQTQISPIKFSRILTYQGKPLKLYPFQTELLSDIDWLHDRLAIQKGRAIGASFVVAVGLTFASFVHSDARFAIVSKTHEQAGFIFEHVRRFYETSPILIKLVDWRKTKVDELHLTNGTIIVHRTAGAKGDTLRGFHLQSRGALVLDESSSCPSRALQTAIPAAVGGAIIHVSTPKAPSGEFYRVCTSDPDYRVIKLPSTVSPRISKSEIEAWRRMYSPSDFRREVLAEFSQGSDAVFDPDSIERNIDHSLPLFTAGHRARKGDPQKNYVYSLDISKIGCDRWVLTIGEIENNQDGYESLKVVAYHSWSGTQHEADGINSDLTDNPNEIISDIVEYAKSYWPLRIYCDATSNEYFCFTLKHKHNLPVEEIVWSTSHKQRMIEHLASCFRADKIKIPNDPDIVEQLLAYSYDLKRMQDDTDKKLYLGMSDDFVSSLCQLSMSITWDEGSEWVEYLEVASYVNNAIGRRPRRNRDAPNRRYGQTERSAGQ